MYYDRVLSSEEALYVSRAQQKIAELAATMAEQYQRNDVDEYLQELATELQYSVEVLKSTGLVWTADEIRMMMDYYSIQGDLVVIPFRSIVFDPSYSDPSGGQIWATVPQLRAVEAASIAYDAYLLSLIQQAIIDSDAGDSNLQTQIDNLNITGGSTTVEIISDISIGGIIVGQVFPIGTNLEDIWIALLSTPASVINFTFDTFVPIVEVGDALVISQFTWGINGIPTDMVINDSDGQLVNQPVSGLSYAPAAGAPEQNLGLWSEVGDNAVWETQEVDIVANDIAYPTGGYSGDKFVTTSVTTINSTHTVWQEITKAASAIEYTVSGYFRADEVDRIMLRILGGNFVDGNRGGVYKGFDLTDGSLLGIGDGDFGLFVFVAAGSVDMGNGWYRCWVKGISDSGTDISFNFGPYSSGEGNNVDGFHFRGMQINTGDIKDYTETTSVPIDTPGVAGLTYNFNTQETLTWTISGNNIEDVVIDVTAFYRSYYYKETAASDALVTPTEVKILAGTSKLVDTVDDVTFTADTGNSDQGVIAVPQTQTVTAYTKWFVDTTNFSFIPDFIVGPVVVVVNGINYDVYQWGYRSPLVQDLKLHR